MHSGAQDLVLFEGKIAQEFGVSRTPVRQVIQALAAESLVEVRSGVGTFAPPLLPERRQNDLTAYAAILGACAACPKTDNFTTVKAELVTLRMLLEADSGSSPQDIFFDISNRFIAALCDLVEDKILRDALVACFWRFVRRRIVEHKGDISVVIQELIKTIKDAEYGAETGNPEHVLRMVATNADVMIKSAKKP